MLQARNFMKPVVPGQTEEFESLFRIGLPIIQAGSNDRAGYCQSRSGGVPQGLSYPSPKLLPLRLRSTQEVRTEFRQTG